MFSGTQKMRLPGTSERKYYRRDAAGAQKGENINTEETEKSGEHRERWRQTNGCPVPHCGTGRRKKRHQQQSQRPPA